MIIGGIILHIMIIEYNITSVSSQVLNLNFCSIFTIAILDSNNASLNATQVRGPIPKGRYAYDGRFALFSSVNLQKSLKYISIISKAKLAEIKIWDTYFNSCYLKMVDA